ncbi:hypothetical protein DY000_02023223 [Brassica cretica]|uniref:Uncharacterized protein n=1 Tax=Brassica cretica TaxID=69181 RepID=A0ABQ7EFL1_BRACR|nr:hypothetical protein DY000_02023223 [Brassica cretica]
MPPRSRLSREEKGKGIGDSPNPIRVASATDSPLDDFDLIHRDALRDTENMTLSQRLLVADAHRMIFSSKRLRRWRSVDFERLRWMRRSHAPALSLSRRSPFECSLGSGSPVEIRRDFRASNVVRRSLCVELLLFSDSNFRFRTSLKSSSTGVSSFSSSDDKGLLREYNLNAPASKKARKSVGTLLSFFDDGVSLLDVLVCSKRLRRSVDFERFRRMRRSHAPALSLSRRSPFECSLGLGSPVEIRRDFRASNVVRKSLCVKLLLSSDSNFRFRTSLKSSSTGVSSFSSSDDKVC